ncbi:MAG: c-type cytochrome [Caulobacteraceae bacterium]
MVYHGTPACASCHGMNGEGERVQNAPRLAGLDPDYIVRQLEAFKHGDRQSQAMVNVARTLNDAQRQALAAYYANLPAVSDVPSSSQGNLKLGRMLAEQGNWAEKVPPCASCHGGDGLGVNNLSPPLAGQRADYLQHQLMRFRQNERRDDPLGLMRSISAHLSMREIRAISAYYATLPPRPNDRLRLGGSAVKAPVAAPIRNVPK